MLDQLKISRNGAKEHKHNTTIQQNDQEREMQRFISSNGLRRSSTYDAILKRDTRRYFARSELHNQLLPNAAFSTISGPPLQKPRTSILSQVSSLAAARRVGELRRPLLQVRMAYTYQCVDLAARHCLPMLIWICLLIHILVNNSLHVLATDMSTSPISSLPSASPLLLWTASPSSHHDLARASPSLSDPDACVPNTICYRYPRPAVTVDTIIVSSAPAGETDIAQVLLIQRKNDPYKVGI